MSANNKITQNRRSLSGRFRTQLNDTRGRFRTRLGEKRKGRANTNHIVLTICSAKSRDQSCIRAVLAGPTAAAHERKNESSRFGVTLRLPPCGTCWDTQGCASLESLSATSLSLPCTCCVTTSSMLCSSSTKAISAPIPSKSGEDLANFAVHCRAMTESLLTLTIAGDLDNMGPHNLRPTRTDRASQYCCPLASPRSSSLSG